MKRSIAVFMMAIVGFSTLSATACNGVNGQDGVNGKDGKSAYQVAVDNGFLGTEAEWLESLKGVNGQDGQDGAEGKSAYDLAVENGFTGTEAEWLLSLVGKTGVGIAKVELTLTNELVITLTDGTVQTVLMESCEHSFSVATTDPTCLEEGCSVYTCEECGFSYTNDYVPALGHHYVDNECFFCHERETYGVLEADTSWYDPTASSYDISTKNQLAGLAELVNGGNNFAGKKVCLAGDVDLENAEWTPIGNATTPFAGTFDGRLFTIKNLKISTQKQYVGLFGYVTGSIKRFSITGANITVNNIGSYVSIACGRSETAISEISVDGYIVAPDCEKVGGVVGYTIKDITKCSNAADIFGGKHVGGIVGHIEHTHGMSNFELHFSDLSNSGNVNGLGEFVGGIMGELWYEEWYEGSLVTMDKLTNNGAIGGTNIIGGIAGKVFAYSKSGEKVPLRLTEFSNTGEVIGITTVGGLVGHLSSNDATSYLKGYTQTGNVEATETWDTLVGSNSNVTLTETL